MNTRDLILALLVNGVWGANFTVIKVGLTEVPPVLLAALRYIVVALPAIFFVRRPKVSLGHLLAYGLTVGVGQFAALFYAMFIGMPAGLASVVLQSQTFFTVLFAYFMLKETITWRQVAGIVVAGIGLVTIALNRGHVEAMYIPLAAILLTMAGAASWALSNIVIRLAVRKAAAQGQTVDTLGLIVWSALVPPLPLFGLALLMHGPQALFGAFTAMTPVSLFSVAYLAYGATLFGFGMWSKMLAKYPASTVAPFSMLVPVIGLLTARLVLAERLTPMQWGGSVCIVAGLLISTGLIHFRARKRRETVTDAGG